MGRTTNPVIAQYFERGRKLQDHSNRYEQHCKLCGKVFAKGRHEAMRNHISKECPGLSQEGRVNACLSFAGLKNGAGIANQTPRSVGRAAGKAQNGLTARARRMTAPESAQGLVHPDHNGDTSVTGESMAANPNNAEANWSPLETLAEVSRRVYDQGETREDQKPNQQGGHNGHLAQHANSAIAHMSGMDHGQPVMAAAVMAAAVTAPADADHMDLDNNSNNMVNAHGTLRLEEQYDLNNPPLSFEQRVQRRAIDRQQQMIDQQLHHLYDPNITAADGPSTPDTSVAGPAIPQMVLDPQLRELAVKAAHEVIMTGTSSAAAKAEIQAEVGGQQQPEGHQQVVQEAMHAAMHQDLHQDMHQNVHLNVHQNVHPGEHHHDHHDHHQEHHHELHQEHQHQHQNPHHPHNNMLQDSHYGSPVEAHHNHSHEVDDMIDYSEAAPPTESNSFPSASTPTPAPSSLADAARPVSAHSNGEPASSSGHETTSFNPNTVQDHIVQDPAVVSSQNQQQSNPPRGGVRMDTSPGGTRTKNSRAKFEPPRREQVSEMRRLGACMRCRILRKTCSPGIPCDQCRKILAPRVWRTTCTRAKMADEFKLYSAGVQVVMAQRNANRLKEQHELASSGAVIEAYHFPEAGLKMVLPVLQFKSDSAAPSLTNIAMIDDGPGDLSGAGDVATKVEAYMDILFPELINRESSDKMRVILKYASGAVRGTPAEGEDELLRRSLKLWGLVELMDRERQWIFLAKDKESDTEGVYIKEDQGDLYTRLCTQVTAGAERKAENICRLLLSGVQRMLADAKTRPGFPLFLACITLLNCIEKTTWAFKAWEGEALYPQWPLEKIPRDFYNQGADICGMLKMLFDIRRVSPKIKVKGPNEPVFATADEPEVVQKFFQDLKVTREFLKDCHDGFHFDQSNSRSIEFIFCSTLLMP